MQPTQEDTISHGLLLEPVKNDYKYLAVAVEGKVSL